MLDGLELYFFICAVLVVFRRPDQEIALEYSMLLENVVRVGNFKVWESFRSYLNSSRREKE